MAQPPRLTDTSARRRARRTLVAVAITTGAMTTLPPAAMAAMTKAPVKKCAHAQSTTTTASMSELRSAVVCLLRRRRAALGAGFVKRDDGLARAGTNQARQMVRERYFAHVGPDGRTLGERLASAKWIPRVGRWRAGEILAFGTGHYATPVSFVQRWMKSPTHFEVLKNKKFTLIGVGLVQGTPDGLGGTGLTAAVEFGRL